MGDNRRILAGIGLFVAAFCLSSVNAWGSTDSVLLKDIQVLTLYNGKSTTGGRSSPVPQLECVKGGTASCNAFRPRVVQCYNRGWDGSEVQWECTTDMDNAYRFGEIEVSCEGYSHRDDPYVLKGSCGLRYTIDYTKEGLNQQRQYNYYGDNQDSSGYYQKKKSENWTRESWFADMIVFVAVLLMCWAFYKTCVGSRYSHENAQSTTNDDYPGSGGGGGGGYGWFGQGGHQPTAPPHSGFTDDASCGNATRHRGGGTGAGGFWTGAITGGLLGYMFGNTGRRHNTWGAGGWGNSGGWGSGSTGGGFSGGGFSGGGSTGTRTASGFGGTSRR
ncbi:hypothetical protein Pmani_018700 [Petrolisthes manimaculis]|uniref:Store-operated calcium entry-associated regulatory factor n=1 Tax=Petrolisthes manimaculis TaxID=1843537 RepID=A0AAE1PM10_9EUCA|nr:hypothetical protein Pmani_018700 [Petrolisthes manimaculis]